MSSNTPVQEWNASRYAHNARFVSDLGQPVLDLLNPKPGERILDLGCGDGALTEKIAAAGAKVIGVDASADMVTAAKQRGLDVRVMDAYSLQFDGEFDAVFSNAALHAGFVLLNSANIEVSTRASTVSTTSSSSSSFAPETLSPRSCDRRVCSFPRAPALRPCRQVSARSRHR